MATSILEVEHLARQHLIEPTPNFWSSDELRKLILSGSRDLWRAIVDLKAEYYLTRDNTNVSLAADTATITGIPTDVYKVYLIEPRDVSSSSSNKNLYFKPLDYNHAIFQSARTLSAIDPSDAVIYYAITGQGAPTGSGPTIYVAPQVSSAVNLSFVYVPILSIDDSSDNVPIPGEADNALAAWTVAFARAKEREDRSPDPNWLQVYATEKQNLLQSLNTRQLQEPEFVEALFEEWW